MMLVECRWRLVAAALAVVLMTPAQPGLAAEPDSPLPRVRLATELGDIVLEIEVVRAPETAANFLAYVDAGLFSGARFYRVVRRGNQLDNDVEIDVVQGGLGIDAEAPRPPIRHETTASSGIRHRDGTLSMARLAPGSASSEFFICIGDQPELDFGGARNPDGQGFAAFGRVVSGTEVVRAIHQGEADGQALTPPVEITSVERVAQATARARWPRGPGGPGAE